MPHRNREFQKQAEQPKPVEGSDGQSLKNESQGSKQDFKSANPEPKQISIPQSVPVKKTRTRVVKQPSRFNDSVVLLAVSKLTSAQ